MSRYTLDDIGSKLASLTSEVRELRRLVEQLQRSQAVPAEPPQVRHVARDDGAVFIPGTGYTGTHQPLDDEPPLDRAEMLDRIRTARHPQDARDSST